jgi:hypothetical protein
MTCNCHGGPNCCMYRGRPDVSVYALRYAASTVGIERGLTTEQVLAQYKRLTQDT